jgi:hypothetical protein
MSTGGAQRNASSRRGNNHEGSRRMGWLGGNTAHGKHNRIRASKFRKSIEFKHVIELADVEGNCTRMTSRGQMNGTRHETVMQVLTQQAQHFHHHINGLGAEDHLHFWSLDETGTVETSKLHMWESETEQLEISEVNKTVILEEVLQVHGYAPPKKAEGMVQLICENVNGFINRLSGNEKVDKAKEIHDELEVDIMAYCEHQLNMWQKKNGNGFN